jgi:hypothetical protein
MAYKPGGGLLKNYIRNNPKTPPWHNCDCDCLSCDKETYVNCERRINPYVKKGE